MHLDFIDIKLTIFKKMGKVKEWQRNKNGTIKWLVEETGSNLELVEVVEWVNISSCYAKASVNFSPMHDFILYVSSV